MTDSELYAEMQARWVKDNNVKVGDTVRILRDMKEDELGCAGGASYECRGIETKIEEITLLYIGSENEGRWPFFCLEVIKKAEPTIKITCEVNDKKVSLKALSEETILNIRRQA